MHAGVAICLGRRAVSIHYHRNSRKVWKQKLFHKIMPTDGPVVNVHVLFFAKSRELARTPRSEVDVPAQVVASELLEQLVARFDLTSIRDNLILAHNETYIENLSDKIHFKEGDELAIIPPLSGG